ncbi:hypothetical protein DFW101_3164 [Solidesulfovibrio carbinoliphilus subsp. oakridgensis]|uniref:Uncharacterized protein n=1 Tax=Solidesulfovibrio carbinoliphilus subsp. oakridgensis TaxID=694327 RepID=G7Q9P8_9BACT|nr:hypothetical protein [Solidesulfovibrio carbinoliphilus]EHJ49164.1 hypothetical protein DFW101_3164 [Solidesulfovibrio carbinoliphilus subsp. oakridgensis]
MISDRMWERAAFLTRYDGTPEADFTAALAGAHFAREAAAVHIGTNVPDETPHAISTRTLDTGLGAIVRAEA